MLWSERCVACGESAGPVCDRCRRGLRRAVVSSVPAGLDVCRSLLAYEGPGRDLVTGLKYRNDRRVLTWLVDAMVTLLDRDDLPPGVVVTWVPTTGRRRAHRGFDQARLLARGVARRWGVPCPDLLVRGPGPTQSSRTIDERHQGVPLTVRSSRSGGPVTRPVVVVDDVMTTGASLTSAAQVLRAEGCSWVAGLTAAYTPRLHPSRNEKTPVPGGRT